MEETTDSNSFLKNYFRLVAGFTGTTNAPRAGDDRLHDLSGFVQQASMHNTDPHSLNCSIMKHDRYDANPFLASSTQPYDVRNAKSFLAAASALSPSFLQSPIDHSLNQRRHSIESTTVLAKSSASSSMVSPFSPHSSLSSSQLPGHLTAAQLCRIMWNEVKHRDLRCAICLKNVTISESSTILQHTKLHCDFESFECLLCRSGGNGGPYRTNKYQVMYGHMKSAHRGRMIMNETWRRLSAAEVAKIDVQLIALNSARASIHDDAEEDRRIRDIMFQCFGEWVNIEIVLEQASVNVDQDSLGFADRQRDNGSYYYLGEKPTMGNYQVGTTTLALPLKSAPYTGPGTNDLLPVVRDHAATFSYSNSLLLQHRESTIVSPPLRRISAGEIDLRQINGDRANVDRLMKSLQSRKCVAMSNEMPSMAAGLSVPTFARQYGNAAAAQSASAYLQMQSRARKRVSGGSRSLPALETINQLCQQLRNESSYYDGDHRTVVGQNGVTSVSTERRPRIWCHICRKAIELPEAASRYMTEHVASAHTTSKLFCCASCPYEAKTYTQVKAHIKNHHPATATAPIPNGNLDEKYTSLKDTFTVKEETMIPLLKACFMGNIIDDERSQLLKGHGKGAIINRAMTNVPRTSVSQSITAIPMNKPNELFGKVVGGRYKCRRCSFSCNDGDELSRHRRTTLCAYTWPAVRSCSICGEFTTRFPHVLDRHIERVHKSRLGGRNGLFWKA